MWVAQSLGGTHADMRILLRLFNATRIATVPALGRWHISYAPAVISIKIDQANEDHGHIENAAIQFADNYLEPFVMY
jgi:hypothetical protein